MDRTREDADLAIHLLERMVEGELSAASALSTKASVILGLSLTGLAAELGLGQGILRAQPLLGAASSILLLVATVMALHSYRTSEYRNLPDPPLLLSGLATPRF